MGQKKFFWMTEFELKLFERIMKSTAEVSIRKIKEIRVGLTNGSGEALIEFVMKNTEENESESIIVINDFLDRLVECNVLKFVAIKQKSHFATYQVLIDSNDVLVKIVAEKKQVEISVSLIDSIKKIQSKGFVTNASDFLKNRLNCSDEETIRIFQWLKSNGFLVRDNSKTGLKGFYIPCRGFEKKDYVDKRVDETISEPVECSSKQSTEDCLNDVLTKKKADLENHQKLIVIKQKEFDNLLLVERGLQQEVDALEIVLARVLPQAKVKPKTVAKKAKPTKVDMNKLKKELKLIIKRAEFNKLTQVKQILFVCSYTLLVETIFAKDIQKLCTEIGLKTKTPVSLLLSVQAQRERGYFKGSHLANLSKAKRREINAPLKTKMYFSISDRGIKIYNSILSKMEK